MEDPIRLRAMEDDRYDRSRRTGWLDIDAISRSKVLMVGAGALGNEVAKNLALSGFEDITVVDMDHVVGSNLNRCLFFSEKDAADRRPKAEVLSEGVSAMVPSVRCRAVVARIEDTPSDMFSEADVVFGCLDNIPARIFVNSMAYSYERPFVDGGMDGFAGRVMVVRPPEGACLQCGMNRSHARVANLRFSCTGRDAVFHNPTLAAEITTTSVLAAVMVREGLKQVCGRPDSSVNNVFYYDGLRNMSEEMEVPRNPECPVHDPR